MTEEKEYLNEIEKCSVLHNHPFRIHPESTLDNEPDFKTEWRTGYQFWNAHKMEFQSKTKYHMIGFEGTGEHEGKFFARMRYAKKDDPRREFSEINRRDYDYVVEINGKQRTKNYFEPKRIGRIEFLNPTQIPVWNSEARREEMTTVTECFVVMSEFLYGKFTEQYDDPRTNIYDYMVINFDNSKAPAEKYAVKFSQVGQPFSDDVVAAAEAKKTATTVTATSGNVLAHELPLIADYDGDETTKETLIQAIMMEAETQDVSMTEDRAAAIADAVLVDGVVRVPA